MNLISLSDDDENLTWQDRWERAAVAERSQFEEMTSTDLIDFVKNGRLGGYYNVWYVIAQKCSLKEAGWLLLDVIEKSPSDLVRYHALAAQGQMLGLPEGDERLHASLLADFPVSEDRLQPIKDLLVQKLAAENDL